MKSAINVLRDVWNKLFMIEKMDMNIDNLNQGKLFE